MSVLIKNLKIKSFSLFVVLSFSVGLCCSLGGCGHFEPDTPPPPSEDAEERPGLFSGEKGKFEFNF